MNVEQPSNALSPKVIIESYVDDTKADNAKSSNKKDDFRIIERNVLLRMVEVLTKTSSSTLIYGSGDLSAFALKVTARWVITKIPVYYYSSKTTLAAQILQDGIPANIPGFHYFLKEIDAKPWKNNSDSLFWISSESCAIVFDSFISLGKLSQTSVSSELVNSLERLKTVNISPWILVHKSKLGNYIRSDQWDNIIRVDSFKGDPRHSKRFLITIEKALYYDFLLTAHFVWDTRNSSAYRVYLFGGKYQQLEMCVRKLTSEGCTGSEILKQFPPVVPIGEPISIPSLAMLNRLKRLWGIRSNKRHKHRKKAK